MKDATMTDDEKAAAMVGCPICQATGLVDGQACLMCAGSGEVRADAVESILETLEEEGENGPRGGG